MLNYKSLTAAVAAAGLICTIGLAGAQTSTDSTQAQPSTQTAPADGAAMPASPSVQTPSQMPSQTSSGAPADNGDGRGGMAELPTERAPRADRN